MPITFGFNENVIQNKNVGKHMNSEKILKVVGVMNIAMGTICLIFNLILIGNYNYLEQNSVIEEAILQGYIQIGAGILLSIIDIISGLVVTWWEFVNKRYIFCLVLGSIFYGLSLYTVCTNIITNGNVIGVINLVLAFLYIWAITDIVQKEKESKTPWYTKKIYMFVLLICIGVSISIRAYNHFVLFPDIIKGVDIVEKKERFEDYISPDDCELLLARDGVVCVVLPTIYGEYTVYGKDIYVFPGSYIACKNIKGKSYTIHSTVSSETRENINLSELSLDLYDIETMQFIKTIDLLDITEKYSEYDVGKTIEYDYMDGKPKIMLEMLPKDLGQYIQYGYLHSDYLEIDLETQESILFTDDDDLYRTWKIPKEDIEINYKTTKNKKLYHLFPEIEPYLEKEDFAILLIPLSEKAKTYFEEDNNE